MTEILTAFHVKY